MRGLLGGLGDEMSESWSNKSTWPLSTKQLLDAYSFGFRFAVRKGKEIGLLTSRGQVDRLRKEGQEIETFYIMQDGTTRPCARGIRTV